jgi:hypothetical protein
MQWGNFLLAEFTFIILVIFTLGFIKLPRFLRRRKLARGFPWGYYSDSIPNTDPGFLSPEGKNFLYDTGAEFGGMEGFGEYGDFSGFGELGEYGSTFFADGGSGGE